MAVAKKTKSMEEALWESANKLRGSVEPAEYKHIVLSLIFFFTPALNGLITSFRPFPRRLPA